MSGKDFTPKENQKVSILFKNGKIEYGIVLYWSDYKSVIKSLNSDNIMIIQQTLQDVMAVKIFIEDIKNKNNDLDSVDSKHNQKKNNKNEFRPTKNTSSVYIDKELELNYYEPDPKLRALGLAELQIEKARQEKEMARKHMFTIDMSRINNGENKYVFPSRIQQKVPSAISDSAKKDSGSTGEGD